MIIQASWNALVAGIDYKLQKDLARQASARYERA
jgi:hypothetical protein